MCECYHFDLQVAGGLATALALEWRAEVKVIIHVGGMLSFYDT